MYNIINTVEASTMLLELVVGEQGIAHGRQLCRHSCLHALFTSPEIYHSRASCTEVACPRLPGPHLSIS